MNREMKQLAIVLFSLLNMACLFPATLCAQGWEKTINTSNRDFGISVATTQDGHYVVAGTSENGLGTGSGQEIFLIKIDDFGNVFWTNSYGHSDGVDYVNKVIATSDGGFLLAGRSQTNGGSVQSYLVKTDANGLEEWSGFYENVLNAPSEIRDVVESNNGGYIFAGYEDLLSDDLMIGKVSDSGDLLWMKSYDESGTDQAYSLVETPQNEIIAVGFTNGGNNNNDFLILKTDADGNEIWTTTSSTQSIARFVHLEDNGEITTIGNRTSASGAITRLDVNGNILWTASADAGLLTFPHSAAVTNDGGFIISGIALHDNVTEAYLLKLDNMGNEEWHQYYGGAIRSQFRGVTQGTDMGYLVVGDQNPNTFPATNNVYIVKTDIYGRLYSNIINGRIANDTSADCVVDITETGLTNWIVEARKEGQRFFGSSDSAGVYEITADTGMYQVIVHPPNLYWSVCADSIPLTLVNFYDTTTVDFAAQAAIECPLLVVDVGTPFLRRCFDNVYTVSYCNDGTLEADSAYVDITLDPYLNFISSTLPAQMLSSTGYRFMIGDIDIGECGSFDFVVNVDCDSTILGQTHCVEAHIYPDSLCLPLNSSWSGAFVEVDAVCQDSLLEFSIENTGSAPMDAPLRYVIIEDAILLMTAAFELGTGEVQDIPINNNGATYFIYAEQEPGAPGNSIPILSVEGCVVTPGDPFSTGFFNQFPQNDLDPFIEIDCRPNVGSYDPNDKQGFPLGYGDEHFIEANTEIEYLIRFQNTGTDTAFTVVIKDSLSTWLDPTTVRPGASSHPYDFNLSSRGVLTFTFNNILLPDSTTNQLGSNGFVKFRIAQKRDNPTNTRIENRAAIFFDFNPPILTNTTFHTVGEDLIIFVVDTRELLEAEAIKVYPNPMQHSARLELNETEVSNGYFELYNAAGELVRQDRFSGSVYEFARANLPAGFYFFRMGEAGKLIAKGKVIIQ